MVGAAALGAKAEAMIAELAAISAEPDRLVRLFLTSEHRRAADLVSRWMTEAGLEVREDALGTVRGSFGAGPKLLIGSHIDTVVDAGRYDGPLGVIAGILAAREVIRSGRTLPFGIEVLAFGDEEGSRFPDTMTSSRACAGAFDPAALQGRDADGVTLSEALSAYGKAPDDIASAAYGAGDALAYIEVHIEQGPVLEQLGRPLGIVTGIVGQTRLRATVSGEAGHAGTVPMRLRRDPFIGAAAMGLALERIALDNSDDGMVATIGRIGAMPGAVNVIPGRVTFTVDLRSASDAARLAALKRFRSEAEAIAAQRGLQTDFEMVYEAPATPCDAHLQDRLAAAASTIAGEPPRLPSGAGHDAQIMAKLCPSAMLFVRCKGGISHNPAEYASLADMGAAMSALIRLIEELDPASLQ